MFPTTLNVAGHCDARRFDLTAGHTPRRGRLHGEITEGDVRTRVAFPRRGRRCILRNLTRFGSNIAMNPF